MHIVSPRNHFLFTPLLPSTTVGTLEFRAIQEPVRTIPQIHYYQSVVSEINFDKHTVTCGDVFKEGYSFDLPYDALLLAPGSETNTLGVQGVTNNPNVFFLKQLRHSRAIRNHLIDCFERADSPAVKDLAAKQALLTFIVVGGGPTNIEFASELHDFIKQDVSKWYPDLLPLVKVKVVEASGHILGTFNSSLVSYVEGLFKSRHIDLLTSTTVKQVKENVAHLSDGSQIEFGMMVWSTGIKQVALIENLSAEVVGKFKNGRLMVDQWLRVCRAQGSSSEGACIPVGDGRVFALGDCAGDHTRPLPALAQVASQQAQFISKALNKQGLAALVKAEGGAVKPFKYAHLGSMASVGEWKGVYDSPSMGGVQEGGVTGLTAFLLWRAAYWTKQVSLRNKILIPMYWFKTLIFGRDIARF